jgi:hypothetical protein
MILGSYSNMIVVKTRSVVQVVIEVPIERGGEITDLLGFPNPSAEVPVVIARMDPEKLRPQEPAQIEHANDDPPYKPRPLSQIAAMLCTKPTFKRFIYEGSDGWDHIPTTDEAAEWVRSVCQVGSRKELDTAPEAAERFRKIRAQHDAWLVA